MNTALQSYQPTERSPVAHSAPSDLPLPLGAILVAIRCQRRLGMREVASRMEIGPVKLMRWERSEAEPSADELRRLLEVLEVEAAVRGDILSLAERAPTTHVLVDPDAGPPDIFRHPEADYEVRLATLELHARSRMERDLRWVDWLAQLRIRAVGGFLRKGCGPEARAWTEHALHDRRQLARHPSTYRALFILHRLPRCHKATESERFARQLVDLGLETTVAEGASWALMAGAEKWAEAGCPVEAIRTLELVAKEHPDHAPIYSRAGFHARVLSLVGQAAQAIDLVERVLPEVTSRYGAQSYPTFWLTSTRVSALARQGLASTATNAIEDYRVQTSECGEIGAGWWRKTCDELPRAFMPFARSLENWPDSNAAACHLPSRPIH